MFSGFKKVGVKMGPDQKPPDQLPDGVIGLGGFANRLLVISFMIWTSIISYIRLLIN